MKRFTWVLCLVLGLAPLTVAEEIDAVYFNPSRFGNYNALRIMNELDVEGNMTTGQFKALGSNSYTIEITNPGIWKFPNDAHASQADYNKLAIKSTFNINNSIFEVDNDPPSQEALTISGNNTIRFQDTNAQRPNEIGAIESSDTRDSLVAMWTPVFDFSGRIKLGKLYEKKGVNNGANDPQLIDNLSVGSGQVFLKLGSVPVRSIQDSYNVKSGSFTFCKGMNQQDNRDFQLKWYERLAGNAKYKVLGCVPYNYTGSSTYSWEQTSQDSGHGVCEYAECDCDWIYHHGNQHYYKWSCSKGSSSGPPSYPSSFNRPSCGSTNVGEVCYVTECSDNTAHETWVCAKE